MWKFRPQAFRNGYYGKISNLLEMYQDDNHRAASASETEDAVVIPVRPARTALRTCQWNVHFFDDYMSEGTYNHCPVELATAIIERVLETEPDVIVLNEFGMSRGCEPEAGRDCARALLESGGYTVFVADCICPTAIATKLTVLDNTKFQLDIMRDSVAVQLRLAHSSSKEESNKSQELAMKDDSQHASQPNSQGQGNEDHIFWVYGTHLEDSEDDQGGNYRLGEIKTLIEAIGFQTNRVMIIGVFNQQRKQDYTRDEWQLIVDNKQRRKSPVDDGVAYLLKAFGYGCIWDRPFAKDTNWRALDPPPSSHWSGTIVDYTYHKDDRLLLSGVYVSPSNLSDHRLIVCDWELRNNSCRLDSAEDRSGPLLAVWNIAKKVMLGTVV